MAYFLVNLIEFIGWVLLGYMWVVIIAALITWVNPDPYNPIVRLLRGLTEPVMRVVRRFIPTSFGGFDIAPVIIILLIVFIRSVLLSSLIGLIAAP